MGSTPRRIPSAPAIHSHRTASPMSSDATAVRPISAAVACGLRGSERERASMSPASKINQSSLSAANLRGGTQSPTKQGVYWFHSDSAARALLVEVRVTNEEVTVWWPNEDQPVTKLTGHWRGPIPPSSGPSSRQPLIVEMK